MRFITALVPVLLIIHGCSDDPEVERTNFAEVTVDGKKFAFNSLEATVKEGDITKGEVYISSEFTFTDTESNSYLTFTTVADNRLVNKYKTGEFYPIPTVSMLHLQTYINKVPSTYVVNVYLVTVTIDKDKDNRMHGSLYGKLECITCSGNEIVEVSGEFEVPYNVE